MKNFDQEGVFHFAPDLNVKWPKTETFLFGDVLFYRFWFGIGHPIDNVPKNSIFGSFSMGI